MHRQHTVNMETQYESIRIGATVEFDDQTDDLPRGYAEDELSEYLSDTLDELLMVEVKKAMDANPVENTHLDGYYNQ